MTYPDECQFTLTMSDLCCALGLRRTTLWRFLCRQEMAHVRFEGVKHYAVSDVVTRLRPHPKYRPTTEITLLLIDQQRRQVRQYEAQ
jgi:hypothetical protein